MAQAQTIRFGQAIVLLGTVPVTGAPFVAPCGVEELTMTINIESTNTNIPDCNDPDLASWLQTDIISKQMVLSGSGVLDRTAMQAWQAWWHEDSPAQELPVRFFRDILAADGGGYFQAPAVLTSYAENAARAGPNRWRNTFAITLNGKPVFTAAS